MSGGYSLDVVAYFPAHGLREESRDILFLIGFILTLVLIFLLLLKVIFGEGVLLLKVIFGGGGKGATKQLPVPRQ